jgi:hypothetical protein
VKCDRCGAEADPLYDVTTTRARRGWEIIRGEQRERLRFCSQECCLRQGMEIWVALDKAGRRSEVEAVCVCSEVGSWLCLAPKHTKVVPRA